MHVHWAEPVVTVYAPAKLNLFLEILRKRDDGFHEIETLMAPIARWDTLRFEADGRSRASLRIRTGRCRSNSAGDCRRASTSKHGAIMRYASFRLKKTIWRLRGQAIARGGGRCAGGKIELLKRIPMAAGMAGGSSDCAAALVAANIAWGVHWSRERLASPGGRAWQRRPVLFRSPSGDLQWARRTDRLAGEPGASQLCNRSAAGWSFDRRGLSLLSAGRAPARRWRRCSPPGDPDASPSWGSCYLTACKAAAEQISPWVGRLRNEFDRYDFLGHQLTGSGSAYFGLCHSARHARRLASALRGRGFRHGAGRVGSRTLSKT